MTATDLHRVDASLLEEGQCAHVAGRYENQPLPIDVAEADPGDDFPDTAMQMLGYLLMFIAAGCVVIALAVAWGLLR